jgi:hypothetical protein
MATVVTSIGSNSSIDTETPSSCSGSYSPYSVTFSTTPTGVNIGDKVEIVDESSYSSTFTYRVTGISGTSYTLAYVTDTGSWGDVSPCDLLDFSWGQAPATFKRFYTSITNWEAGLDDSDVYSSSDVAVGECHNDSVFAETVVINGGGTVGLASVKLSVHSGSRHTGTAGTGARVIPSGSTTTRIINIARDDVTVEWLEISGESATSGSQVGVYISLDSDDIYINNNIIHDMAALGSAGSRVIGIDCKQGANRFILNNFIYAIISTSTVDAHAVIGIYATRLGSDLEIYNNTVFDVSTLTSTANGIVTNSDATVSNNIVLSCDSGGSGYNEDCFEQSANAASDYNLSDDTTAWGSNSVTSSDGATAANTIDDTTSGSENLHLVSGSYALGAGTDLGTTPTGVEIDIDGRDRDAEGDTWDIGADQAVGMSVSITPAAASFELAGVSPSVGQSSLAVTVAVAAFVIAGVSPTTLSGSISVTPSVAAFELAGITPTTVITGSASVSPAAAAFELAGITPTLSFGSATASPSAAPFELAGVSPTILFGSTTASPAAATFELAGVSPSVIIPEVITPAAASFELAGVSPTAVAGSLSVTPSASAFEFAAVDPSVGLSSLTVAPGASAIEFAGVSPSVVISSQTITPAVAALELAGISPTVTLGSLSVTPAAAITNYRARYGAVIFGGIVVIPVTEAEFAYTAVDPAVGMSSQTVAVAASAFELAGVTPSVIVANIIIYPAASVVEFAASVETIHAGVEVPPAAAVFDYVVGSFTLRVEMDSASLGYACDGLNDYIGGTIPTDYSIGKNLDYKYDHQS